MALLMPFELVLPTAAQDPVTISPRPIEPPLPNRPALIYR